MNLTEYIELVGDKTAAHVFGVSWRTTQAWRLRNRQPTARMARKIEKITKGKVKFEDCFVLLD